MATPLSEPKTDARILSPEEGRVFFDETCRAYLNMSGEEFLRRWDAGEYAEVADDPAHADVMYLAMLIPSGR